MPSNLSRSEEGDSERATTSSSTARPELTRSYSAGKGGCWTCRVRRKKCDEEREGDSCKTCLRLRIKCLGWGPKRPEWMRDKDKVAEYKASIKDQLSRAGLIRGQPRAAYLQHANSTVVPTQSTTPPAGPGPSTTSLQRSGSGSTADFSYRRSYGGSPSFSQGSPMLPVVPSSTPNTNDLTPMNSFVDSSLSSDAMFFGGPTISMTSNDTLPYDTLLPSNDLAPHTGMATLIEPSLSPSISPSISQDNYILYYFQEVRNLQFVFAGSALGNLLYSILLSEPQGAVTHAICALSSLHSARLRISRGLEVPNPHPERSIPKYFYDQAAMQLMTSKTMGGHYSEKDAIAALYLVGFSTLSGGSTNWLTMLDIACEWLSETGIQDEQNPKLTLRNMSDMSRFAAQATMWVEVMSSITLLRSPRFLSLYRKLFGSGAGYWASANEQFDVRMDRLTGCPDEAMLALAETANLAYWKASEQHKGTLSVRDLVRRGDQIEQGLRQFNSTRILSEGQTTPEQQFMVDSTLSLAAGLPAAMTSPSRCTNQDGASPTEEVRQLVAKVYRETAVLYLHTVLNDGHPGVPEISNSVTVLSDLFQRLPASDFDRAVMFPMCLAGSMSDDPLLHDFLKTRCMAHNDDYVGNLYQARTFMETVWNRRAAAVSMNHRMDPINWRGVLRDRWSHLLLL